VVARCLEDKSRPNSFYDPKQVIYEKLLDLYNRHLPIEVSVVAEELKAAASSTQIGGYAYLAQVSSRIPTTAQAVYFIEKVRDLHMLREIIRSATAAVEDCYAFRGGSRNSSTRWRRRCFGHPEPGQRRAPSR
jgi:replicative DNA helicase